MEKGKLIVIEGSDGSGKQTQSTLLYEKLQQEGKKVRLISFPNYESKSSELIKMYLNGEFGDSPSDSNVFAVSTFYAADRYASFKNDWQKDYENGCIIIADRYTTSNMVHQASKLGKPNPIMDYIDWLKDLEYEKFQLPEPDMVVFLDVPVELSLRLTESRENKFTGKEEKDIHEKNVEYLKSSYNTAMFVSKYQGWDKIGCYSGENILSREDIHGKVWEKVLELVG